MIGEKSNKMLIRAIEAVLVAVMVTPLVFYRYFYYPFVTGKVLAFRLLVFIALLLAAIYIYQMKRIRYHMSILWWLFLGLVGAGLVSAISGVNFERSFWSSIERADGLLFLIHLFVFFALLVLIFKDGQSWKRLFRVSLATSLVVIGYGLLQYAGLFEAISTTGDRISSTLGNPAYLGSYALIHVFLTMYLLSRDRGWGWRIFYSVGLLFNFWVIFLTQTRGSVIGLVAGLFSLALLSALRGKKRKVKLISLWGLMGVIVLSGVAFSLRHTAVIQSNATLRRVTDINFESYTVQTRLAAWKSSFEAFKDRPLLGWGGENYGYAFSSYFPPEIYTDSGSRIWFDKAHSIFFEYLVAGGILGTLAYFSLLVMTIYYLWRSKRLSALSSNIFISLLAGYTLANMFVFDTLSTYILFAAMLAFTNNVAVNREKEIEFDYWKLGAVGVLILFFIGWGYVVNVQAIGDNKKMLIAAAYAREGYTKDANAAYIDAVEGNTRFTRYEIAREYAVFARNQANSLADYEAAEMFNRAIEEMQKSIEADPQEIRHYYNLSQLYLNSYKYDSLRLDGVIDMADKMIELAPRRAHTYYQIGEAYILKREYDKGLESFQRAVALNPKIIDVYINIYAAAILKGETQLIEVTRAKMEELNPGYFNEEETLLRFVPLYKQAGLGDRVVESLEKLIALAPEKIEYVSSLAIYYAEQGKNQQAEETVRRLSGLSPELDIEIEKFIGQIRAGEFLK